MKPLRYPLTVFYDASCPLCATELHALRDGCFGRGTRRGLFLIDVSGSMQSPDKLPLVKQAFRVLAGRLRAGTRLPSSRALAAELGVSHNPSMGAFLQLLAEGYLVGGGLRHLRRGLAAGRPEGDVHGQFQRGLAARGGAGPCLAASA